MNDKKNLIIIVLVLLVLMLGSFLFVSVRENIRQNDIQANFAKVMSDTVSYYKNKQGKLVATISSYQSDKTKDFLEIRFQDSTNKSLQKLVKQYEKELKKQGSATTFSSKTDLKLKIPTTILSKKEKEEPPTYLSSFTLDKWVEGSVISNFDTTQVFLTISDEYDVILGRRKKSIFKYEPFVDIITHNPYNKVKTIRSFNVSNYKTKKLGLGLSAGYGVFIKNGEVKTGIIGGVTLNYILIPIL